ncbi:carbohydrate sulfotransferase 3-like [Glandiceps talaboti]
MLPTRRTPSFAATFLLLFIVCALNLGVLISNVWNSRDIRDICDDEIDDIFNERHLENRVDTNTTGANILVHARMRTGSSFLADHFNLNPDVFYVYEPGFILNRYRRDIWDDSWMFLEDMRSELLEFVDGIYKCNFTDRDYFLAAMNDVPWMRQLTRTEFLTKVNERGITNVCAYRKHKLVKTVRLNNLIMAVPILKEHNVKIIQIIRDPRGMASSRARFQIYKKRKKSDDRESLLKKLDDIVVNYCAWMETNYLSVKYGPEWLKRNYRLVRFEDLVAEPAEVMEALYNFAGLTLDDKSRQKILKQKNSDPESWRYKTGPEIARRAQQLCPARIYNMFGYRLITDGSQLVDKNFSTVTDIPLSTRIDFDMTL